MDTQERYRGCMIVSAAGDALGAPVEFKDINAIKEEFGERGITEFSVAYGRLGAITDDTQMAMATARGLLRARETQRDEMECVRDAYLEWLESQSVPDNMRGPGMTCLGGLKEQKDNPTERADNDSKGCGGVMRVHPVGLYLAGRPEEAFALGMKTADLSHGHATSGVASGAQAALVAQLVLGIDPAIAVQKVTRILSERDQNRETIQLVDKAMNLALMAESDNEVAIKSLGEGWVAEEALAISLYCFLHHLSDPFEALIVSVNHSGDSDSTGAICGAMLGAAFGMGFIPTAWIDALEHNDQLKKMGDLLSGG